MTDIGIRQGVPDQRGIQDR